MSSKAAAKKEDVAPAIRQASAAMTPLEMLNAAIERGDGLEKLEKLMDLNDRYEKAQAKREFLEAKAAFKANAPTITKDLTNKQYDSKYSSIGNVVNVMNEALSKVGLDARWDYEQTDKSIKVTCILSHLRGHSESVSLAGPPDVSGAKNPIQQIKSTTTYLKLATFEAVTGIASKEGNTDDDGNGTAKGFISEAQCQEILDLIGEVGADTRRFCAHFGIDGVAKLPADKYKRAVDALTAKRGKS